jgi:hypothetical protein
MELGEWGYRDSEDRETDRKIDGTSSVKAIVRIYLD